MKPEAFEAAIKSNTDRLYVIGNRKIVCKNGAFLSIGNNQVYYQLENSEIINIKRSFTGAKKVITIKGDFTYKIAAGDTLEITFSEHEAYSYSNIKQDNNFKYNTGDLIYSQGGICSSDRRNITGEYTEFTVTKVDPKGKILEMSISSPGKYIAPPQNPVKVMNDTGEFITVDVEYDEAESSSVLEKDVKKATFSDGKTQIELQYPIPDTVTEGLLSLKKQVIILNKKYGMPSVENVPCELSFDFSPIAKIPLLSHESLNPYAMYNEGIKMIEKKFIDMEKRISNLENRNY